MSNSLRSTATLALAAALLCGARTQGQEDNPESLRLLGLAPGGIRSSVTESWGTLRFLITNSYSTARHARILVYYPGRPDLQFGRDVWVPGAASLAAWLPVGPAEEQSPTIGRKIEYLLYDITDGHERLLLPPVDERVRTRSVLYRKREPSTAVLADMPMGADPANFLTPPEAVTFARTIREADKMSEQVFVVQPGFLPTVPAAFEGVDHFLLASNRLAADPAGQGSLRHWVQQGGKLWVMLDLVQPELVASVLGDDLDFQIVDRVSLTTIQINRTKADALAAPERELEQPVNFIRMLLSGRDRVLHTVNGWPASFTRQVGRGKVLFTTLGPRGWHRPRTKDDPPSPFSNFPNLPMPLVPLLEVAAELRPRSAPHPFSTDALQPLLSEEIGYTVISQQTTGTILIAFVMAVLGFGVAARRSRRPELLGWLGSAAAIAAAGLFLALGEGSRRAVPPTVAVAEVVEAIPGSGEAAVNGLAAFYRPASGVADIGAGQNAVFDLDATGLEGQSRRRLQTDLDSWHWDNLSLPAGVRAGPFRYTTRLKPLAATARFGPTGLSGRLTSGAFHTPADAIITTAAREPVAVRFGLDGTFEAGAQDTLPAGQFLAGAVLTDQQQRRQAVYRQLITSSMPEHLEGLDLLLAWAEPEEIPFAAREGVRRTGSALLIVPLDFERPANGTSVTIPAAFVPFRRFSHGHLEQPTLDSRIPVDMRLRFQIPPAVLPLKIAKAVLTARVRAPGWRFGVAGFADTQLVSLQTVDSPVEPIRIEIADEQLLKLDERGGLHLSVSVSDGRGPGADRSQWKIESLGLEITGKTE
jgi:hypothetical protein